MPGLLPALSSIPPATWPNAFQAFKAYARAGKQKTTRTGYDPGLSPLPFADFQKQAMQFVKMLTAPQYAYVNKQYNNELASGQAATNRLAGALAQYLSPIYGQVQGAYNNEQQAMAGANNAIRTGLDTNTGAQNAQLGNYLQLSGGPQSYQQNAQGLAQNVGQSYSVRAAANQGALASHGLADSSLAAELPGLAALRGEYDFGNLQRQLALEASQSRDKIAADVPNTLAQLFTQYRTGEENKAIARAAYPKTAATVLKDTALTAADWARATGLQVQGIDGKGNPIYRTGKNGQPLPLKPPTPKKNPPGSVTPANTRVNDRTVVSQIETWAHTQPGLAAVDPNTGERIQAARAADIIRSQLVARGWSQAGKQAALHEQVLNILASLGYPILPEWRSKPSTKPQKRG